MSVKSTIETTNKWVRRTGYTFLAAYVLYAGYHTEEAGNNTREVIELSGRAVGVVLDKFGIYAPRVAETAADFVWYVLDDNDRGSTSSSSAGSSEQSGGSGSSSSDRTDGVATITPFGKPCESVDFTVTAASGDSPIGIAYDLRALNEGIFTANPEDFRLVGEGLYPGDRVSVCQNLGELVVSTGGVAPSNKSGA